jgi:glutamine phosphoribosylpyrophosphate amidotransferase
MCGIIGYKHEGGKPKAVGTFLQALLLESCIRGVHATGVTTVTKDYKLNTLKEPIPAAAFIREHSAIFDNPPKIGIFHCRYSTSGDYTDNTNNQPLQNATVALAHNGIVSQAEPSEYKQQYGLPTLGTANDSEIILARVTQHFWKTGQRLDQAIILGLQDIDKVLRPIFACVMLDRLGSLCGFRDEIRPLYRFDIPPLGLKGFCSTDDILLRAARAALPFWDSHPICEALLPFKVYPL